MLPTGTWIAPLLTVTCLALAACKREERQTRIDPAVAAALEDVAVLPGSFGGRPPEVYFALGSAFRTNAYSLSEGKRLFGDFGCRDCHGDGEGTARGPALMDGWWRYGPKIETVYLSIRDGRPGGMPPFRDALTHDQLWQLAGYIQVLGAYVAGAAAPGRRDERQRIPAENRAPARSAPLQP